MLRSGLSPPHWIPRTSTALVGVVKLGLESGDGDNKEMPRRKAILSGARAHPFP
jgi:hypothetical protein